MIREWLTDQGFLLGPGIALLVFLAIFLGVLAWVYRPGSSRLYDHDALLPLEPSGNGHRSNERDVPTH